MKNYRSNGCNANGNEWLAYRKRENYFARHFLVREGFALKTIWALRE